MRQPSDKRNAPRDGAQGERQELLQSPVQAEPVEDLASDQHVDSVAPRPTAADDADDHWDEV